MKEQFKNWNPQKRTRTKLDRAIAIIDEMIAQGYILTIRMLFYQMVSRDYILNTKKSYDGIVTMMTNARMAGLVDWEHIEDKHRSLLKVSTWKSPSSIIHSAAESYRLDRWKGQPYHVETWIEKDALTNVIAPTCHELFVNCLACKGYLSASAVYDSKQRMCDAIAAGKTPIVIHMGDHDPSGIDMTRDIRERLSLFTGETVKVERIALNYDQVQQYNLPPNFAKESDKRFAKYADTYGEQSWELDALHPSVLTGLVRDKINSYLSNDLYQAQVEQESDDRKQLFSLASKWDGAA